MATVAQHYESHLAPVYLWMAGGIEHALDTGAGDIADLPRTGGLAVDLGAGFGMHAIPLARAGYRVLAIDSSKLLLGQLEHHARSLPIDIVTGDLLEFRRHLRGNADLVLCMGDTLTHLEHAEQVTSLFRDVAESLAPSGTLVVTFRDYSQPRLDESRFIPVRSDADRILTCFLEDRGAYVFVHDILHERVDGTWTMTVSSYRKLKLSADDVTAALRDAGLDATIAPGPRGMLKAVARR